MEKIQILNDYIEETNSGYSIISNDIPNIQLVIIGKICYDKQVPTPLKHGCHLLYHIFRS